VAATRVRSGARAAVAPVLFLPGIWWLVFDGARWRHSREPDAFGWQVWINAHGVHAINHLAPYGGVKQSGIGRKSRIRRNSRVHAEPDHHDA